jgi:hypothetical protein
MNKTKVFMNAMLNKGKKKIIGKTCDSEEDLEDLDVEDILKIYKKEGIYKKDQKEMQE